MSEVKCLPIGLHDGGADIINWCTGMRQALRGAENNSTRAGLSVSHGWLVDAPKDSRPVILGVAYTRDKHMAFILNFCPWCGTSIRFDKDALKAVTNAGA